MDSGPVTSNRSKDSDLWSGCGRLSVVARTESASSANRVELPVVGGPLPERADAARNRQKILEAARRLFAEHGPAEVTMEAVAGEAGVGKGTVFRRFGDRGALLEALLDEQERQLQERILRGPSPLGPGAPATTAWWPSSTRC